jgi:hypothetical protein
LVNRADFPLEMRIFKLHNPREMEEKSSIAVDQPEDGSRLEAEARLEEGYRAMAGDEAREAETLEWIEGTMGTLTMDTFPGAVTVTREAQTEVIPSVLPAQNGEEVTARLNEVYAEIDSKMDSGSAALQFASLPKEEW